MLVNNPEAMYTCPGQPKTNFRIASNTSNLLATFVCLLYEDIPVIGETSDRYRE